MSEMSKRCVRVSLSGLSAMSKHGREVKFCSLTTAPPSDEYERLYKENKTIENVLVTLKCLYFPKPSEKVFQDNQLNPIGDAVVNTMTYQFEQLGVIGKTLDDYNRIAEIVLGCRVVVDTLKYSVNQVALISVLEGYPLQVSMSLKLLERSDADVVVEG